MHSDNARKTMTSQRRTFAQHWHPLAFAVGCGFAVILLASWFVEPTRTHWLALDHRFFFWVNGWLATSGRWQVFWALANNRMVDIVSALAFIGLYGMFVRRHREEKLNRSIARGLLLTGMVIAAKQITEALATLIGRKSPTLVYPEAIRLSELVPEIPTKDVGNVVFPGDHATILLVCAGVVTFYLPLRYAVSAWIAAAIFSAPRLVGGGHWLTDNIVGSAAVAAFMLAYVFATPLHRILTNQLERGISRIRTKNAIF